MERYDYSCFGHEAFTRKIVSTHSKAFTNKVDSVSAISGGHFWSANLCALTVTCLEMHLNSTLNIPDKCPTNLSYTSNLPKHSCHRVCRWSQRLSNDSAHIACHEAQCFSAKHREVCKISATFLKYSCCQPLGRSPNVLTELCFERELGLLHNVH